MIDTLKEFTFRRRVALLADHLEITTRLIGFLDWMEGVKSINKILKYLNKEGYGDLELEESIKCSRGVNRRPPQTRDLEDIASFGLVLVNRLRENSMSLGDLAIICGIRGKYSNYSKIEAAAADAALNRYVVPFLDYVEQRIPVNLVKINEKPSLPQNPALIFDSLKKFSTVHRNSKATCFIMMRFGKTKLHSTIEKSIKETLSKHKIVGVLARDREFHEDLFPNILTYLHGCTFGIAVFERLETEEFNPNVALEVGYMLGLKKHVLLLKDQTLRSLHTDLVGKLYREFDPQNPLESMPVQIDSWLTDKGIA